MDKRDPKIGVDLPKWLFTFAVFAGTLWWGNHLLEVVTNAANNPDVGNVIEVTGASGLMGALITWTGLIIYHWFRKGKPVDKE